MEFEIRTAVATDASALLDHLHRLFQEEGVGTITAPDEFAVTETEEARLLERYARSENRLFLVAYAGNQLVGELNLSGGDRKALHHNVILGMSVRKEWRNRGIGSALLERALKWARETPGVRRVELAVIANNHPAVHLYERFGFVLEGRRRGRVLKDGQYLDDLVMALWLEKSAP